MRNSYYTKDEAKNQFIQNEGNNFGRTDNERQKAEEYQKMFMMFQKMATDPSLFMKMMSSVASPESEQEQRKRQFQVEQHKYRNHEVSPKRRDADSPIAAKQSRKRGADVLGRSNADENDNVLERYYNAPIDKGANLTQSSITISTKQQHMAQNEDRPIQSAYALNKKPPQNSKVTPIQQEQPVNRYTADDQRPIKPAKGYNYEMQSNQSGILNNNSSVINPSKYYEAEERPIKGIQGDFKAHIMKEQGFPMNEQAEENQEELENSQVPKARTFLKRGSRQYLSSAKDKSVTKKKPNTKADVKQQLDFSKTIMKDEQDKPQRSISQNRVLGRKSVSSKSISKRPAVKPKGEQQKKTLQYSNTTSNYNSIPNPSGNRTPRMNQNSQIRHRENSSSPTFQTESEVKVSKPAKKNIFQGSSSDEEDQKTQSITNKKTQIIPGVFLTKKELHQILTKFGKNASTTPPPDLSDLQELKSKYIELSNLQIAEKQKFQAQMMKQKEQFQQYKLAQIAKIKNQRKVQERNLMNMQKNKEKEKQKQQFQNLKKTLQKEREEFRHKEKNYKLMIQKYKKSAEQRQKSASIQQQKTSNVETIKNQEGLGNKKKAKNSGEPAYTQTDEVIIATNSYKGVEENNGYNINKRANQTNKDASLVKENNKLPNYQDLKKSSGPANSSQISNKMGGSVVQQNNDRNKKYEYIEELDNKQTVKNKGKLSNFYRPNEQQVQENENKNISQDEERQEIVEYNPSMKLSDLVKIPLNIKMVTDRMIDNLFRSENNPEYKKYLELTRKPRNRIHTSRSAAERKTTNVYADGGKQIVFDTGVRKQYFTNGYVIIFFSNGDIKQKLPDETVLYFYKEKQVDQITLPDKTNIYRFDNNQIQFHFEDGTVQVRHPDGTYKIV